MVRVASKRKRQTHTQRSGRQGKGQVNNGERGEKGLVGMFLSTVRNNN